MDTMIRRLVLTLLFLCFATATANAANIFAVCTTTCTWDSGTAMWSTSSGGVTGAGPPGAGDTVIFDSATCVGGTTCTTTVNTNPTITAMSMGGCTASTTGCIIDFSVHNNNITMSFFSGSGSGVRILKMGNGTWTITCATPSCTVWDANIITNFTLTANSSTILFQATTSNLRIMNAGGSLTYNTLTIGGNSSKGVFLFGSSFTAATFNINPPNAVEVSVAGSTVTNQLTWTGTAGNEIYVFSSTPNAQANFGVANGGLMSWVAPRDINFQTGSFTAINSFDLGNNGGITITPPGVGGTSACILGGWLLWRDMPEHLNDNFPAWLEKAA